MKRKVSTFLSVRVFNPLVRAAAAAGLPLFGVAILETRGRRSGRLRRTPVGPVVDGRVVWIVAEHGRRASYVQNIAAEPRVRIRLGRTWRTGTARAVPEEDPRARLRPGPIGASVRMMGSDLLVLRIDLDP